MTIRLHGSGNVVTSNGATVTVTDSAIGHDSFAVHGGGQIVLVGFAATSKIVLGGGDGYFTGADALAHTHDTAAGAVLDFGSGAAAGEVLFRGMYASGLHASSFAIV